MLVNGSSLKGSACTIFNCMKKVSIRELRYAFPKIERMLGRGDEIQITKRGKVIARLVPEKMEMAVVCPDFLGRLRAIYGSKFLKTSGAELVEKDRGRS
jgi:antitoxin (DNA-binding transcriptional repressor) of toxin-antitoxin stability system